MSGMVSLFIVPTPIGNLEDITLRALRILKEVGVILTEDTRKTGILLRHYGIGKKMVSHHQFNEHKTLLPVIQRLKAGATAALVSDAGTPGISDPGYLLIRECIREGLRVECLPGPTALIPAIVSSGIACDQFFFAGFLPHKKGRQSRIETLAILPFTIVLYESPHRLLKTLDQLASFFGENRQGCISREMTKIHEEHKRGNLRELCEYFSTFPAKGEVVIVVEGFRRD
jgi:16S rRNA (cytidine1402-2'-O)-methyltransferase